jgi:hypothetical protein
MTRRVSIDVRNPMLQSFETDTASISVGRDPSDINVQIGPHNRYNVAIDNRNDGAHIHATGVQRILVDLPREAVRAGSFQRRGGQAVFGLQVNSQYLGSGADQLVLKYNVYTCKMNFFSICLGSYKPGQDTVVPVTQTETFIGVNIPHKMKAKVVYTLARKGSRWYNDSYISNFETDSLK